MCSDNKHCINLPPPAMLSTNSLTDRKKSLILSTESRCKSLCTNDLPLRCIAQKIRASQSRKIELYMLLFDCFNSVVSFSTTQEHNYASPMRVMPPCNQITGDLIDPLSARGELRVKPLPQARGRRAMDQRLNRKWHTSASRMVYSLPSMRSFPASLIAFSLLYSIRSSAL